jgi:ABC-2 type transport system ATP-binding protein/lipopolysaccharide transport system ATP-binding protein
MMRVIEVEDLGKRYRLGEEHRVNGSLRETLAGLKHRRRNGSGREDLWALRHISFAIDQGQTVGLIGRNGAGKSTLLKILARITEPTEGVARVRGRVGALLEVGTAFHQELTGRENISINGALLGMSKRDIRARFEEIVEFAGIHRFLDTPVKRYSSGMYMRLAFAVAAHFEPEVVVVDEVLAIGDAEFQARCLGKMSQLGREGRTVLFVSHDVGAVGHLCSRTIWFEKGAMVDDGPTERVVEEYLRATVHHGSELVLGDLVAEGPAAVVGLEVETSDPETIAVSRTDPLRIKVRIETREHVHDLDVAIWVNNSGGMRIIDEAFGDVRNNRGALDQPGVHEVTMTIPPVLPPGEYTIGVWLGTPDDEFLDQGLLSVQIVQRLDDSPELARRARMAAPPVVWDMAERLAAPQPAARNST